MPPRKASTKAAAKIKSEAKEDAGDLLPPAPGSGPSRRSARQANAKWNVEYGDESSSASTSIKEEPVTPSKGQRKANIGAKRSAPGVNSPEGSAKRVKFEKGEDGEVKAEISPAANGLLSPEASDADEDDAYSAEEGESGSELSDVESEGEENGLSEDEFDEKPTKKKTKAKSTGKAKKPKTESPSTPKSKSSSKSARSPGDKAASLQKKKLKTLSQFSNQSPFPDFLHPTPDEARLAHKILAKLHGERKRPEKVVARSDRAGCGDSPSVLDALVRTILSQNTSDKNSTRAKLSMDKVYGGSDKWDAIVEGGQAKLQDAIKSGGLSVVKSKVIISILEQVKEKYGKYSLDHMFDKSNEEAMQELISYQGVGPKTASCVLLFCLKRESFAVDTHVYRIAGLLGWRPQSASRDETYSHLEVRIPDEDKYGLHILMVGHGKKCEECKAGGRSLGKCELRKAFRKGKLQGEAGEVVKEDEEEQIKKEKDGVSDDEDAEEVKKEDDEDWEGGQEEYVHGMQGGKKGSKKIPSRNKK